MPRNANPRALPEKQRDSELQSLSPVEPPPLQAQGNRPAPAILLALHFLCMHDSGHMRSCICKASWGEQGTRRVHTTLLRAELPGSIGIGDHAICE